MRALTRHPPVIRTAPLFFASELSATESNLMPGSELSHGPTLIRDSRPRYFDFRL
jgi:hypothetical protein